MEMLLKLCLVVLDDTLTDEFSAFNLALINDDLVMLTELYLVVFDGLIKSVVFVATLLDVVDDLQQVDRH